MTSKRVGIIGGSGLYEMEELEITEKVGLETPFGNPSDEYVMGRLSGVDVVFLARHGRGHRLLPSEINYRANVWGMKKLGVEQILSVSAVGSLKEEIVPGNLVFADQFIDRTYRRNPSFFGDGVVAHVALAEPICASLRSSLGKAAGELKIPFHPQGTYLCIEGPQFSTKAESHLYRSWNCDVIGMTNVTEAKLAREAQICYATVALATDYDCWHAEHDSVTADQVIQTLLANVEKAKKLLRAVLPHLPKERSCACATALRNAVVTDKLMISHEAKKRLALIMGK
ncbi:MAG: S-methyl-5'-thioadenosine phosphorylase [bacterium]